MQFTVDRKTWYRGKGSKGSRLLREDGMMCCLGHVSLQCGLTAEEILDRADPASVSDEAAPKISWLLTDADDDSERQFANNPSCAEAMETNDDEELADADREKAIVSIFANWGHELTFVN